MSIIQRVPWRVQPQYPVAPNPDIPLHTFLTPVWANALAEGVAGAGWRTVKGPLWTAKGTTYLSFSLAQFGRAVNQTTYGYFERTNPITTGARSFGIVFIPSGAPTAGIWSAADTYRSGGPRLLLQQFGTTIRFLAGAAYICTFTGVAVAGKPLYITWSISNVAASAATVVTLCINGEVKTASITNNASSDAKEFLLSGYTGEVVGDVGEFWGTNTLLSAAHLQALSTSSGFWGGIYAPQTRRIWVPVSAGGGTTITVPDSAHAHTLDNAVLTSSTLLAVQDMAHGHALDAPTLSTDIALTVADSAHAHTLDNVVLSTTGATSLTVADLAHAHTIDAPALTSEAYLAVADSAHAHALDNVVVTLGGTTLAADELLHAHTLDNTDLTIDTYLAVA